MSPCVGRGGTHLSSPEEGSSLNSELSLLPKRDKDTAMVNTVDKLGEETSCPKHIMENRYKSPV